MCRRLICLISIVVPVLSLTGGAQAGEATADTFVRGAGNGDTNYGSGGSVTLKNANGNSYDRKGYLRFDVAGAASEASLDLTVSTNNNGGGGTTPQTFTVEVYGLAESLDHTWAEDEITWNNAPGNDTASSDFGADATLLGSFIVDPLPAGNTVSFSDPALVDFINSDNDNQITLMLRRTAGTSSSHNLVFASKENTSGYSAPTLHAEVAAQASGPNPANGQADVLSDVRLAWTPGEFAVMHDVYLGMAFDDVNDATTTTDPTGAYQGRQSETTYVRHGLDFGQTYYWRIDEVNAPPDQTVFRGRVWSFEVEPVSIVLPGDTISVTASSMAAMQDANNVINGSGLNDTDAHTSVLEHMWSTTPDDPTAWIQFDFDSDYKFDKVHVWNHNSQTETVLGFGIKEALIEYSLDGETWTESGTVELAQAPGSGAYTGFDLPLNEIVAKHIRLTALSNWSALGLPQRGLSEVRFYWIPVKAREPRPADGSETDTLDVILGWRPGRESVDHEVVFGEDPQAVIDGSARVATVTEPVHDVGTLDLGTTYFWKIDEVNDMGTPPYYEGDLWSFTLPDQIMIDDFESYQAQEGLYIWEHWIDGFDNPNENGAVVGNGDDPETGEVYEGRQSMPLAYDNTAAPKSEATRTFDPPLDLAAGNPRSIEVYVKGIAYEFNGYYSVDGSSWTDMSWNPRYVVMSEDARVGMAVTSHDAALETTAVYSNVSTTGDVTGDWTQADIGGTHPAGNFTAVNGTFTIKALGVDIWGTADDFRYVSKHLNGAGSITAQVQSLDPVNAWTKVGVMIRDAAVPEASNAGVYATGANGVRYQARLETAISATSDTGVLDGTQEIMTAPVWVRMERKLANGAAPIYLTLIDSSGQSATVETGPDTTTSGSWTLLSAAPGDLDVNLTQIEAITVGVGGIQVEGKIFVDAIRTFKADVTPQGN